MRGEGEEEGPCGQEGKEVGRKGGRGKGGVKRREEGGKGEREG